MNITGTFVYDDASKTITFRRDDGEPMRAISIRLPGGEAEVFGIGGKTRRQYQDVQLWFASESEGKPQMATATPVPRDWRFRPGLWAVRVLSLPTLLDDLYAKFCEICAYRPNQQTGNQRDQTPKYKRPPRAAFMPEFRFYFRERRCRIVRSWLWCSGMLLGMGVGYLLV